MKILKFLGIMPTHIQLSQPRHCIHKPTVDNSMGSDKSLIIIRFIDVGDRCWWQMIRTVGVDDKFEIQMTDFTH